MATYRVPGLKELAAQAAAGRELAKAVKATEIAWEYKGESARLFKGDVQRILDMASKVLGPERNTDGHQSDTGID